MIKFSRQVDYALQLLIALSKQEKGSVLSLRKISVESTISFLFLQKIASQLKAAGIVEATMGSRGGYILSRPISKITLHEVIGAVEKRAGLTECVRDGKECVKSDSCTIKSGMAMLNSKVNALFSSVYVIDLYVAPEVK